MPAKNTSSASQFKNASTDNKKPVKTFRLGRIKAVVWENETDQTKFYNVTFARTYLDDAKQYHDSQRSMARSAAPSAISFPGAWSMGQMRMFTSARCEVRNPDHETCTNGPSCHF